MHEIVLGNEFHEHINGILLSVDLIHFSPLISLKEVIYDVNILYLVMLNMIHSQTYSIHTIA